MKKRSIRIILLFSLLLPLLQQVQAATQKKFTLVLDAGHGGGDSGTVGKHSKEKHIALSVVLRVGKLIEREHPDVRVLYTRKSDHFVPLHGRASFANKHKADLFISIHCNSQEHGHSAYGTETFVLGLSNYKANLEVSKRENSVITLEADYQEKYEGYDPHSDESLIIFQLITNKYLDQSTRIADLVQQQFSHIARKSRGVKQQPLLVLRETAMPSILIELGFLSNPAEEAFLLSNKGQDTLAKAIAQAFSRYKSSMDARSENKARIEENTGKEEKASTQKEETKEEKKEETKSREDELDSSGVTVYRVQILTAERKLSTKDRRFHGRGAEAQYYRSGRLYKYTLGETTSLREAKRLCRELRKTYKDAFVVAFRNGERIQ